MFNQDVFTGLLLIQDKHTHYFTENKSTIIDYLTIDWASKPLTICITNPNIPVDLKKDILTMLPNVVEPIF